MAEFAQEYLEKLLPALEVIQASKLLPPDHFKEFVSRCQRFEYRFQKRIKRDNDFDDYIKYLKQFLEYWQLKVKENNYIVRRNTVSIVFLKKIAWLYHVRSRLSGRFNHYLEEAHFCSSHPTLYKDASTSYARMLQVHNTNPKIFAEAAEFESSKNNAYDNARTLCQMGLRKFPKSVELWAQLLHVEARYVQYISDRHDLLVGQAKAGRRKSLSRKPGAADATQQSNHDANFESNDVEEMPAESNDNQSEIEDTVRSCTVAMIVLDEARKSLEQSLLDEFYELSWENVLSYPAAKPLRDEIEPAIREVRKRHGKTLDIMQDQMSLTKKKTVEKQLVEDEDIDDEDLYFEDTTTIDVVEETVKKSSKKTANENVVAGLISRLQEPLPELDEEVVKKMLAKAVITEEYDKKAVHEIGRKSVRQNKRERKAERESTKGPGWYNIPATELTEETKRDLELIQMRSAIDPTARYRRNDRKVLPKYFQVGRVVDSHTDFYSGRMTKKQRKNTMVEELMDDYKILQKNKKRYTEIKAQEAVTRKRKGLPFKRFSKRNKTDGK